MADFKVSNYKMDNDGETNHCIVRAYRRKTRKNKPDELYGVVETAGNGEMVVFRSFEQLWKILFSSASVEYGLVGEIKREDCEERR
ncbi:MAG: hypothetical protein ACE5F7_09010, partial [Nitrospiria bacterium]